jgi:glycosyltransferase involved in cell wall biosynthesis
MQVTTHNATPFILEYNAKTRPINPKISCVIPAFNEEKNILRLLNVLFPLLKTISNQIEFIVVDDGSKDNTVGLLYQNINNFPLQLVKLSRNFGKEIALTAGLEQVKGDLAIIIDADLQDPPEAILKFIEHWQAGYDMVFALHPKERNTESFAKKNLTNIFYYLLNIGSSLKLPRNSRDFRVLDAKVVAALKQLPEKKRFMKGLYHWVGFPQLGLQTEVRIREFGKSSFNFYRLFSLAITGITSFSNIPLRVWMGIGATISCFSILYAIYVIMDTIFFGNPIQGWPTLAAAVFFLSGIQLLSIGILGEYIGRIFEESKHRPLYIIDKIFSSSGNGFNKTLNNNNERN